MGFRTSRSGFRAALPPRNKRTGVALDGGALLAECETCCDAWVMYGEKWRKAKTISRSARLRVRPGTPSKRPAQCAWQTAGPARPDPPSVRLPRPDRGRKRLAVLTKAMPCTKLGNVPRPKPRARCSTGRDWPERSRTLAGGAMRTASVANGLAAFALRASGMLQCPMRTPKL